MKKRAFNDMLGKGFDSKHQERLLWKWFEEGCKGSSIDGSSSWDYEWVPEVYAKHGHATEEFKGFTNWRSPCASVIQRLLVYGTGLEMQGFVREAHIIDRALYRLVTAGSSSRVVTANYLEHIKERTGLHQPFSTVDEALSNFSQRLGLDTTTRRALSERVYKIGVDDFIKERDQDLEDAAENPALAEWGLGLDREQFSSDEEYKKAKKLHRLRMEKKRDEYGPEIEDAEDERSFELKDNAPFNTVTM